MTNKQHMYHITPAGRRVLDYLDYLDNAPRIPESADVDRPTTELDALQSELDHAAAALWRHMHSDSQVYQAALDHVKALRNRIEQLTTKGNHDVS